MIAVACFLAGIAIGLGIGSAWVETRYERQLAAIDRIRREQRRRVP